MCAATLVIFIGYDRQVRTSFALGLHHASKEPFLFAENIVQLLEDH